MGSDDVLSLRDYLTVLRRQAWIIVVTTVVVVAVAVSVSLLETPLYQSRSEVVVDPVRRTQDLSLEQLFTPYGVVETERVIITSRPVTERAIQELGSGDPSALAGQVRVEVVGDTRVVGIIATDPDPVAAASIANAYAAAYLDYRRDQAVDDILAARENLDRRANALREEIAGLDAQIDAASEDDAAALEVQRESLLAQLAQVVGQGSELGDTVDTVTGGGAVIAPAEVPGSPVSPRPMRTGALAVVLGLLLGVGLAFLRDHFDDVIRDEADFKRATGGRPILGRIPKWSPDVGTERLATIVQPSSLAAESYRELSAGVRFLLVTHGGASSLAARDAGDPDALPSHGRAVMIASASASEGKTSTAANLAVAAARVGLRTVLVDADLRRATAHKRFGLGRSTGLCDVLLGDGDVNDHIVEVGVDNLLVLPAGTIPPNPAELLASPAMRAVQHRLLEQADLVIYDTPAVLAVPDALELGRFVDLTILVARAGVTSRRQLAAAIERLEQVGTDLAGAVLNDIDTRADGYYYSYYYDQEAREDDAAADVALGDDAPVSSLVPPGSRGADTARARAAVEARSDAAEVADPGEQGRPAKGARRGKRAERRAAQQVARRTGSARMAPVKAGSQREQGREPATSDAAVESGGEGGANGRTTLGADDGNAGGAPDTTASRAEPWAEAAAGGSNGAGADSVVASARPDGGDDGGPDSGPDTRAEDGVGRDTRADRDPNADPGAENPIDVREPVEIRVGGRPYRRVLGSEGEPIAGSPAGEPGSDRRRSAAGVDEPLPLERIQAQAKAPRPQLAEPDYDLFRSAED